MCGRYTLFSTPSKITAKLGIQDVGKTWKPRYNISPSTKITGIHHDPENGRPVFEDMWWGYHPHWADTMAPTPINAQSEHLESSRYFRGAFHHHRCLIPADGWYEWKPKPDGKQPYYI